MLMLSTNRALKFIQRNGGTDNDTHKQYVLDQVVRALTRSETGYKEWVRLKHCNIHHVKCPFYVPNHCCTKTCSGGSCVETCRNHCDQTEYDWDLGKGWGGTDQEDVVELTSSKQSWLHPLATGTSHQALDIIYMYGGIDGDHHKQWVLDQVVHILTETTVEYDKWVIGHYRSESTNNPSNPYGYHWNRGVPP
jgi:hypothetical protein